MEISADIVVVGTGVGGLFSTLWLPEEKQVVLITKSDLELFRRYDESRAL